MSSVPTPEPAAIPQFNELQLPANLLSALKELGYESPSPIQAATIPALLAGRDMMGQAQTGTGKTAAFALPALARLDMSLRRPQVLVLAPTRELAIQVAEAFQRYACHIPDFHVLPLYGGQSYSTQLAALKRGVHVIVGTPGRVIDHLERGSLKLADLRTLVLDEGDEMLRMGFIDDVESVLKRAPEQRQIVLFSATMPTAIRRIAKTYLRDPAEITIAVATTTATNIRQRYWWVTGVQKLDALTRILEVETFDALLIFTRTKIGTEELAQKLQARGFAATAINGDIQQAQRERTIQQLRDGKIDILVATDVAARGLDVERISHVLNYDVPHDTESYVHRIGRTGRAGRSGEAILFVTPREKNMLRAIERATRQPIEQMTLPTVEAVNDQRAARFVTRVMEALESTNLGPFRELVDRVLQERGVPAEEVAAALASLLQGDTPLLLKADRPERAPSHTARDTGESESKPPARSTRRPARGDTRDEPGMETYRLDVGREHGVSPGNIVGAIANEAGIESRFIGRIDIRDAYSLIDLPEGMSKPVLAQLRKVWVAGQQLGIRVAAEADRAGATSERPRAARPGKFASRGDKPAGKSFDKGSGKPERRKPAGEKVLRDKPPTVRGKPATLRGKPPRRDS